MQKIDIISERTLRKPHPVDVYVGQRLRQLRCLKGLSQQQLGDLLNLTFQQVQKYERGINRLSCSRVHEIAKHLNVSILHFFEGYDDGYVQQVTPDVTSIHYTKTTMQLVQLYSQLGFHLQKSFMMLLRAIAKKQGEAEAGDE